jgi:outer membrane protein
LKIGEILQANILTGLRKLFLTCAIFLFSNCLFAQPIRNVTSSVNEYSEIQIGYSLEDFFSAALNYSPKLNIAYERLKIEKARTSFANSKLLPQIRGNANISDNTRNTSTFRQNFDGNRYSLQLTQTLFNWEAFTARSRAYLREDIAEIEYYGELSFLLTSVAEKYFNALEAQDSLTSIASELEAVQNQLKQVEQLYARQLAQITDLYQAQASVAEIESQQIQLQSQLAQQYESLRSISGIEAGELYFLDSGTVIPPLKENLHYWISSAEIQNHLIRGKELAVEEASKGISQEKGSYLPQVSLIIQRQDSDVGFDNRPLDRSDNTFFGVDISIPLYAGGGNLARVREAKSLEAIALSELKQAKLEVAEKVRAAYLRVEASSSIISAAKKLVASTNLNATAMQLGFELGAVTSVDVLDALRDRYRAERDLQRVRYEYIEYLLLLKRETGTLTPNDLFEISGWLSSSRQR